MFNMNNAIGWIGNVAVFRAENGRWLVDKSIAELKKKYTEGK